MFYDARKVLSHCYKKPDRTTGPDNNCLKNALCTGSTFYNFATGQIEGKCFQSRF